MQSLLAVLVVAAALAAWWLFLYQRSDRRMHGAIWMAFSTTFAAALFLIAGSAGYILDRRGRFFAGTAWSETVIWWEVGVGIALLPLAVFFWRRGARDIDRRVGALDAAQRAAGPRARPRKY